MIIKLSEDELKNELINVKKNVDFGNEVSKIKDKFELPSKAKKLFAIKMVSEDGLSEIQGLSYMYTFVTAKGTFGYVSLLIVPKKFYEKEYLDSLLYNIEKIAMEDFDLSGIISVCNSYNESAFINNGYKEISRKLKQNGDIKILKMQKFL